MNKVYNGQLIGIANMAQFKWDEVQYKEDGKVLLLWRHERIFQEGLVKPGMFCCDVGGWGHLTERMRQEGCTTLIWDKFTAEQSYPDRVRNETYIEADICNSVTALHYHHSFDLVTCFEVLEHVGSGDDQFSAICNAATILKNGGWFVGTFPIPGKVHMKDDPSVTNWLDDDELQYMLDLAGFSNITIEPTGSITRNEEPSSWYFKGQQP